MSLQNIDQFALYKAEQRQKYEKIQRQKYLHDKYKNLLEFDPTKRSASRIVNAVKRYILHDPINIDQQNTIPGLFRLRLLMSELNKFPLDIQRDILNNISQGHDTVTTNSLIQSFKDSTALYWIVIDLRIYGPYPEIPIQLDNSDKVLYLSDEQINKVKSTWDKINPNSISGIRFQQMLDSSKTLSTLYHLSIQSSD